MKKIIISLAAGLVIGYGASMAIGNSEVEELHAQNFRTQQQIRKLSEQLLIAQTQNKQSKPISTTSQPKARALTSGNSHKSSRSKEQMIAQRKQTMERMRTQQLNAQKNMNQQDKNQVKTLDNGTVL